MRVTVVIPARYASTRFDGKPLARIHGKPMIQHVYERAQACARVDRVVVATDDARIRDAVAACGGCALLTAARHRSGSDRVAEAAQRLDIRAEEIVINLQGDQPLIHPDSLQEVTAPFALEPGLDAATLAIAIRDRREFNNPKDVKVVCDRRGDALYFSRAPIPFDRDGDTPHAAYKHLGVYAYRRRFLDRFVQLPAGVLERVEKLEQLRVLEHGLRMRVQVTAHDSPEVDEPADIARIEALLDAAATPS